MRTSQGQLHLLLLLSASVSKTPAFLRPLAPSGWTDISEHAVSQVVSGPLRGCGLLLVSDEHSLRQLNVGRIMTAAGASLTPSLLTTQYPFLYTQHPTRQTKGTSTTAIILFHADPIPFLVLLQANKYWNPDYLVLLCLNPSLNTTSVLTQPVVQRSKFILLLTVAGQDEHPSLQAYTSLPLHTSKQSRPLLKVPLGRWNSNRFQSRFSLFPPRFKDFGGFVLVLSLLCYGEPFHYYDKNGRCVGSNVDALEMIGQKLNFKFTMSAPDGIVWGRKVNGTWNGLLGELMYSGKHLIISVMQPDPDRNEDFDYTYPYKDDGITFLLRVPPPVPRWKSVLYPFSSLMWALLLVTTLTAATVLACLLKHLGNIRDPVGMALKVAAGLLNQPMEDREVRAWWARVWLVCWWVAVDILAAAYVSNLVAVLTVPVYPARISTIQELAESHLIPCMPDYSSFLPDALRTTQNPILATIGRKLFLDPNVRAQDPYARLLEKVMAGTHALIVPIDYLIFIQHRKKLSRVTYSMDEKMYAGYLSWFLPKNTPYTSTLSDHLMRLVETGVMTKLYDTHIGGLMAKEKESPVRSEGVLNLSHLQGAFIVLGLGVVAAALSFVLEIITGIRHAPSHSATTSLRHQ